VKTTVVKKRNIKEVHVTLVLQESELHLLSNPQLLSKSSALNAQAMGLLTQKGKPTDLLRQVVATMQLGDTFTHNLTFEPFMVERREETRTVNVDHDGTLKI
jgi:hypothetical protein